VILANKADVDVASWCVSKQDTWNLKAMWTNCVDLLYTSALSNSNVSDGFEKLCRAIKEHQEAQRVQQASLEPPPPGGVCSKLKNTCALL